MSTTTYYKFLKQAFCAIRLSQLQSIEPGWRKPGSALLETGPLIVGHDFLLYSQSYRGDLSTHLHH